MNRNKFDAESKLYHNNILVICKIITCIRNIIGHLLLRMIFNKDKEEIIHNLDNSLSSDFFFNYKYHFYI